MYTYAVARPSQRHLILDAALRCFAERGYDATRVQHIADRAGVSNGALYRHFPSKQALAEQLYADALAGVTGPMAAAADTPRTVRERLQGCLGAMLAAYRAAPDAATFAVLRQQALMPALPADTVFPVTILERLVREGQAAGEVRNGDPKLLAAIFAGCLVRPLIVAQLAAPGSFDLLLQTKHDQTILDAAWAALARAGEDRP